MTFTLTGPPADKRSRELWLQHAAGFIIFKDMRDYAINRIPVDSDNKTRESVIKGIDDAIYALMMIMDGISGTLRNEEYAVGIEHKIWLKRNGGIVNEIDTLNRDGMCMGFRGWKEGDFGEDNICTIDED